ncbi:MAG: 3-keto-5-aminohexanoate cleavage protein [Pseudomonadota bacterium]
MREPPRVMVSPTGARRQKSDVPGIPLTVPEIAAEAAACQRAGADAIHLHVRDGAGAHSLDAGLYREAIAAVEAAAPGLEIQITTESAGRFDVADQLRCLRDVQPAQASAGLREILRDRALAVEFYGFAAEAGIRVQHILYELEDVARLRAAYSQGLIAPDKREAIFVLGKYAPPTTGRPIDLAPLLQAAGDLALDWMVCAFGPQELVCLTEAMRQGGHARVGFENNIHLPDGSVADSNAQLVALVAEARADLTEE